MCPIKLLIILTPKEGNRLFPSSQSVQCKYHERMSGLIWNEMGSRIRNKTRNERKTSAS